MTSTISSHIQEDMQVIEVPIEEVKVRSRLRDVDEDKVREIAESIKVCGLINPLTLDADRYLLAGMHRYSSMKLLEFTTVPCVIKNTSKLKGELIEIEENVQRKECNALITADFLNRREEILSELGLRMQNGGNQYSTGMITTSDLAKQVGMTARTYRMKREPAKILEEVKDILKDTSYADSLTDMVKLSQQTEKVQRKICNLLITGKCQTFKRAFTQASLEDWQDVRGDRGVDFDVKERWGIPQSIMSFKKANVHLQDLVDLVNKDSDVYVQKRELHFGGTQVPNYMMMADHAEFLVTYYTKENDLVMDVMMGRGSIVLAGLYHNRRVVGIDINSKNVDKLRDVCKEYFPNKKDMWDLHHTDGTELKEWSNQSEILDACIFDPPYTLKNEKYGDDPRDIGLMEYEEYIDKLDICIGNISRLIKKSDFSSKTFRPIIIKVGSARKGKEGIIDMDYDIQTLAKKHSLILWDKMFNKLENVWGNLCAVRNYKHGYVMKNFETNLVFVKY